MDERKMSLMFYVAFPNFIAAFLFICFLVCIVLCLWNYCNRSFISGVDKKFVLVTGCDSGFGRETAITLDKLGFGVFATCLTKKGEESLKAVTSSRVFPLHLDVTESQNIKAVYARVKELLPPNCGGLGAIPFYTTPSPHFDEISEESTEVIGTFHFLFFKPPPRMATSGTGR